MSLSDCEKCWETPCVCGYTYKKWKTERIVELRDVLNKIIFERSDNSDYAKLPNYIDIAIISGVRPSDIKKVCDAIKELGNFA